MITLIAVNPTEHYEELFSDALKNKYVDNIVKTTPENFNSDVKSVLNSGNSAILLKGLIDTAVFLCLILKNEQLYTKGTLLSHCAIFNEKFIATDVVFNTYPTASEKLQITKNAISLYRKLNPQINHKIKISALTPTGEYNPKIKSSVDAQFVKNELNDPDAYVSFEQLDVALFKKDAQTKGKENWTPTDIFLCHDFESGNILYKSFTKLGKFSVAGLIVGAKVPICLNSRADTIETKLLALKYASKTLSR